MNQIVAERGSDAMELLRGAQTTAIQTMIAILNDPMVPARVRLMAADSIIDRVAGKATQKIEAVGVVTSNDPVAEAAMIEAQLEQSLPQGLGPFGGVAARPEPGSEGATWHLSPPTARQAPPARPNERGA